MHMFLGNMVLVILSYLILGCTRGVSGTPIYFANGVEVTNGDLFDLEDWTTFLS